MAQQQTTEYMALEAMTEDLYNALPISDLLPKMISKRVITFPEKADIRAGGTTREQVDVFLSKLTGEMLSKENKRFYAFIEVMRESPKCDFLVERMEKWINHYKGLGTPPAIPAAQSAFRQYSATPPTSQQSPVTVTRRQQVNYDGHEIKNLVLMHKYVIPNISADWEEVAAFLEFNIPTIKSIKKANRGLPRECCTELLQDWITTDNGVKPKTYEKLIEVLSQIGSLAMVTRQIKQCLCQEGVLGGDERTSHQQWTYQPMPAAPVPQQLDPTEYLDEKIMELQEEVFTNCRQYIVRHLSANDIVDHLISKHLIGQSAKQQLGLLVTTPQEKNRIIVDELSSGGHHAFRIFCKILKKNGRTKHIADHLIKEWNRLLLSSLQSDSEQPLYSLPVNTKDSKRCMKLMRRCVIPKIYEQWEAVAAFLNYTIQAKEDIKKLHKTPRECCTALLEDWATTDNGAKPKSWRNLLDILSEIEELEEEVDKIEAYLISEGAVLDVHIGEVTDPAAVASAYEQAVKQGVNEANQFKIVTLGAEGAGKTSTIHSLLDMEFQPDQPSTIGADAHTVICNTFTADRIFVCNWKTREFQHHLNDLFIRHKHEMKEKMTETLTTEPLKTNRPESKKLESTIASSKEQQSKGKEYDEVSRSAGLEVLNSEVTPDGKIRIVIYDLGGQEVYYEVHYLFLASHDVVFLTFNASVSLDEPVVRRHRYTIFQEEYKTRETLTTYEIIEATLHTIYSHCGIDSGNISPRNPTVIMIATHSFNLTEDEKRAITKTLFSRLPPKLCDHFPTNNKDAIHFIDNENRDAEAFNHLRAVAVKAAEHTLTENRPIAYLKFEENVLMESQKRTELSKENALHIAKEAGLEATNEALLALLQYYAVRGILLYYPDVEALKNTIFISPQWVSDLVTCVIKTHDYAEPRPTAELHEKCSRFDKFGLLEETLLDDMLKRSGFSKDIVLALLEKFELSIKMDRGIKFENEDSSYVTPDKGRVFFVPSMLVHNETHDYVPPKDCISNIILYHFPDKFVPVTLFNRVLILVIKWCNAEDHRIRSIFNGVGVFDFNDDNKQSFMLKYCSCTYSIKVHIWVRKEELYNKHLWLQRKNLLKLMQVSINTAHCHCIPKAKEPTAYIECPLHHDKENDPHIRLDAIKAKTLCTKVNEYISENTYKLLLKPINRCATNVSTSRQLVRSAVSIDQIEDKNKTPLMRDLYRYVIRLYATEWRVIGLELNLKTATLNSISEDNPLKCEACFEKTLYTWLQSNPDATWRMLEVAITNAIRARNGLDPVTDIYGPC